MKKTNRSHHLAWKCCLLELRRCWTRVFLLFPLNLWFRFEMMNLSLVLSYSSAVELLRVSLEANQRCPRNVNPFQLVLWHQSFWNPYYRQFAHPLDFKTVWTKLELIPMDLAICWRLSSKTIRSIASTCHQWLRFSVGLTKGHLLCRPYPAWIP